jgi:predicted alpha/beta-hydrolase family hydrolase
MTNAAAEISSRGIDVVTFNFPYTEQGRRVPDRQPVLEACYRAVIAVVVSEIDNARDQLFIGGKSMGGRIATHVAAADHGLPLAGLVLLGYPLHPPGQPGKRRDAHLPSVGRPMLVVQGERDTFGNTSELASTLSSLVPKPTLREVPGGDHSFKVPASRGNSQTSVLNEIFEDVARWIRTISAERLPGNRARPR